MSWEESLKKESPVGHIFVKRVLERSEQIFSDLPGDTKSFEIYFSDEGVTVTAASLAVIAAIGEISAEMFGQICEKCNFPNPRFARFCMNCGTKLVE